MGLLSSYTVPSRDGRIFAATVGLFSAGNGLYMAGGTFFFVRGIGLSAAQVGAGLTIAGLVGFLATVPVSMLASRLGVLRTLRLLHIWRAGGFAALTFADNVVSFTLFAAMLAMAQGPSSPLNQVVVGTIAGEQDRTRTFAVMRTVSNAGMSLGALMAAPFLTVDSDWAFRILLLVNTLVYLGAALLLGRLKVEISTPEAKRAPWRGGLLAVLRDRPYAALTVANGVLFLHTVILSVGLPLWVVESTDAPAGLLSALIAVNTVLAIALQVHFTRRVDSTATGARALRYAGWALTATCLVLALTTRTNGYVSVALLVFATVLLTGGELWQAAGGWELSYEHATENSRAEYLAVFSLGGSAAGIVGPALLAVTVSHGAVGMCSLAVLFLLASAAIKAIGLRLEQTVTEADTASA